MNATHVSTLHAIRLLTVALMATLTALIPAHGREPVSMQLEGVALRFTFGLKDTRATAWDGKLTVSEGSVLRLETAARRQATVEGNTWKLGTRVQRARGGQGARRRRQLSRPSLRARLDAPPGATVSVTTGQGNFRFRLGDLELGTKRTFLEGQVEVERLTLSTRLTAEESEDDWPVVARAPDGTMWVAYTAYENGQEINARNIHETREFDVLVPKGNGDQIRLTSFDGKLWSPPLNVTEPRLDVWRPTVTVDGKGGVWVVWSQNLEGNWDLVARRYDPASATWSATRQITEAAGADLLPAAATHPRTGAVYVAWQAWRGNNFDIWLTGWDGERSLVKKPLSRTAPNEWNPAVAFDSRGSLHVVFDTYRNGNYDVRLVSAALQDNPREVEVAASPFFEARASIAVDRNDHVWVAYEQGGVNWAKDFGTRWGNNFGEQFYLRRDIVVRCVTGGEVKQAKGKVPAELVNTRYTPSGTAEGTKKISVPRLGFDDSGRLWLLYRKHPLATGNGERWASYATYHTGDGWSEIVPLTNSANQLDNRPALFALKGHGLAVVHSTDGRTGGSSTRKQNDLYVTLLEASGESRAPSLSDPPREKPNVPSGHPNEAEDIARVRDYRATIGGKSYRLLRGEFHRHTELTSHRDQDGLLEEIWRYGLDVARMDWLGDGDHDNGSGKEYLWWIVQKQTDFFHHAPTFTPMYTYERSVRYPSGHRNVMFAKRGIRPLPRYPGGEKMLYGTAEEGSPDIKTLYAYLEHFDGICSSHTSGTGMGTDWRDNHPKVEPVVEVYQGHRQNYEHDGSPGSAKNREDSIGGYQPAGFIWNALMRGYRLGFQVSSDHISTHISYGIVFAEDTSREAILDAFKKRHCYGANDNIILDVRCGNHMMGDEFELEGKPTLDVSATGTEAIAKLSIVRGVGNEVPTYVYTARPGKKNVRFSWTDEDAQKGKVSYYYVRIEQQKPEGGTYGALAWASPMWIHVK